jgi:hypothetical protein
VDFTATKYFEVARTAFGHTCWNDTHVGLLGQEVMDGYSLSQQTRGADCTLGRSRHQFGCAMESQSQWLTNWIEYIDMH